MEFSSDRRKWERWVPFIAGTLLALAAMLIYELEGLVFGFFAFWYFERRRWKWVSLSVGIVALIYLTPNLIWFPQVKLVYLNQGHLTLDFVVSRGLRAWGTFWRVWTDWDIVLLIWRRHHSMWVVISTLALAVMWGYFGVRMFPLGLGKPTYPFRPGEGFRFLKDMAWLFILFSVILAVQQAFLVWSSYTLYYVSWLPFLALVILAYAIGLRYRRAWRFGMGAVFVLLPIAAVYCGDTLLMFERAQFSRQMAFIRLLKVDSFLKGEETQVILCHTWDDVDPMLRDFEPDFLRRYPAKVARLPDWVYDGTLSSIAWQKGGGKDDVARCRFRAVYDSSELAEVLKDPATTAKGLFYFYDGKEYLRIGEIRLSEATDGANHSGPERVYRTGFARDGRPSRALLIDAGGHGMLL